MLGLGSATTVKEYLSYFENTYLFFSVPMFDYSLKKQIYAPKKVYSIDTRLSREIGFRFSQDHGRYLENTVFLELKRRGKAIYYHQGEGECDFVIQRGSEIVEAIQVTQSLENNTTKAREVKGLVDAMKTYNLNSGLILTEGEEGKEEVKIEGKRATIQILPLWKWLLLS